ncbi:unnamed protein product [Triticum turgidum subsp. durum]|uniref:Regulator of Vps4 activity in the MVB pathway protein n=1 Tax=Triticum turgidum subsp. durum TaxID=4567 RepID=A0A9R0T7N3_TRITD|nr:unnamed protein product [Triticum turgidum subsp. durum]
MGFLRKFSKQTRKLKSLLELTVSRVAIARKPRLARKSIASGDVCQLLSLGQTDRALQRVRVEQVIKEDNMLEALGIIELYCKCLVKKADQLDKPKECSEEVKEAVAGLVFAAKRCSDLPELQSARNILVDKFGDDITADAKVGTAVVEPMLVWKLSGDTTSISLKKKVLKEIAAENNISVDLSKSP